MVIEPNVVFKKRSKGTKEAKTNARPYAVQRPAPSDSPPVVQVNLQPSRVWPMPKNDRHELRPLWYLGSDFSELKEAREWVEQNSMTPPGTIRIGILDNGFDASHVLMPRGTQMVDEVRGNAMEMLRRTSTNDPPVKPGSTQSAHGTATLGILAGGRARLVQKNGKAPIEETEDYVGAAPNATIVPVCVAPWVISWSAANLAYGIDYASRQQHCDVLSMSHGGAASLIWVDAVNAAYDRGTAMFAATGDFFHLSGTDLGIIVPSSTVYPAALRRVVGVTGVTADGRTYAKNNCFRLFSGFWSFTTWKQWLARGSYGPDLASRWLLGSNDDPDPSQLKRNGRIHAYPIAAYAPNIPWAVSSLEADGQANVIDLDGSGTSAATPQVAAAAALWLQHNYPAITDKGHWRSWQKAEAVYLALLKSAERSRTNQADRYLGAGLLKARRALTNSYADITSIRVSEKKLSESKTNHAFLPLTFDDSPNDYYDGQRSGAQLLMPWRRPDPPSNRVDLRQSPGFFDTRSNALRTVLFNGLLLEEFHSGRSPKLRRQPFIERDADAIADSLERRVKPSAVARR
jgi:hypothetical protein